MIQFLILNYIFVIYYLIGGSTVSFMCGFLSDYESDDMIAHIVAFVLWPIFVPSLLIASGFYIRSFFRSKDPS